MPDTPPLQRLAYSIDDAAVVISVSPRTIHHLIKNGELAYSRIGRRIVIPASELQRLLRRHRCEAKPSGTATIDAPA